MNNYIDMLKKLIKCDNITSKINDYEIEDKCKMLGISDEDIVFFSEFDYDGLNNYLWFISPFDEVWNEEIDEKRQVYEHLKQEEQADIFFAPDNYSLQYPFDFYPEENGILPWAQADNGTVFYWKTDCSGKSAVIVYDEMSDYYEYEMSAVEFLYKLITGKIDNSGLPDDLFENGPELIR